MRNKWICLFVFCTIIILVGCSGKTDVKSDSSGKEATTITETSLSPTPTPIPMPEQVIIANGDVTIGMLFDDYFVIDNLHQSLLALKYNYQPSDVNIANEEWSSSDESVATVDEKGILTPVGLGECEITLHVSDGLTNGASDTISVVVKDGYTQFDEETYPSYDELFEYAENNLKTDSGGKYSYSIYKDTDNYKESKDGFDFTTDSICFFGGRGNDFYYQPYDKSVLADYDYRTNTFYIGKKNDLVMIMFKDRIDIFTNEYFFRVVDYNCDGFDAEAQFLVEMGFPNLAAYFNMHGWEYVD